jgi:D-glycero-D-manno-heptose 1,7-bisphosphate phosphatase
VRVRTSEKVIILDRDGTIVIDRGYLDNDAGSEFAPGAAAGLRWLHCHGYRLVVINNQSGVGRGLFSLERMHEVNARLYATVEEAGAWLEKLYFCPHAPEDRCVCRKPALGLLLQAASELIFDPASAVIIGDKESDIAFGRLAGAKTILIDALPLRAVERTNAGSVAADLLQAALAVATD